MSRLRGHIELKRRNLKPQSRAEISVPEAGPPSPWEPLPQSLAGWTGALLHFAAEMGGRFYAQAIVPLGIEPLHVAVLQFLLGEGPIKQGRLADRLGIDRPSMVEIVNALEAQGLVERRDHPTDRRAFDVHLTPAGREMCTRIEAISVQADQAFFAALSATERAQLKELLQRVVTSNGPHLSLSQHTLEDRIEGEIEVRAGKEAEKEVEENEQGAKRDEEQG